MSFDKPKKDLRCPVCYGEFTLSEVQGRDRCKLCKSPVPMLIISQDGYIRVNWEDLRVLVTYSRRWSGHFDMANEYTRMMVFALDKIIDNLRSFRPEGAKLIMDAREEKAIRDHQHAAARVAVEGRQVAVKAGTFEKDEEGRILSPYQPEDDDTVA